MFGAHSRSHPAGFPRAATKPAPDMREMALSALRDADPKATSQSDPKRLPSRPNLLRKKRFAYPSRNSVARRRSRPEICKYVIDRVGSLGTANSPCLSTANSNCAQSVSFAERMAHPLSTWVPAVLQAYVESSNGWAPTGRGHRHCAAARATRRRELHASTTLLAPLRLRRG